MWLRAPVREAPEIELVVVPEEVRPLSAPGQLSRLAQRACERTRVAAGESVEQVLVDPEVEHEVEPVAVCRSRSADCLGSTFASPSRTASPARHCRNSRNSCSHSKQVCELAAVSRRLLEHERNRIHAEAGDAELQPVPDDAANLLADPRVRHVEVRLEVVEAVKVVPADFAGVRPRLLLHAREDHAALPVGRPLVRPHVPIVSLGAAIASSIHEPRMAIGCVVDDEIDNTRMPRLSASCMKSTNSPALPNRGSTA